MTRYMRDLTRYYAGWRPVTIELRRYKDGRGAWRHDTRTYVGR